MKKKISTYWVCQLGGWGANIAISSFYYFNLSVRKIDHFFLLISISVLLGILFTHIMRMVIKEYRFLEKPIQKQILYFILVTIVFAIIYACADTGLEKTFQLWNLLYYIFHYVERTRRQEVDTLKLQSLVKELELKTIKSHINPHFIFNALNSIRALVDENPSRARTAITELSNILRSSMQTEQLETVALERELNIVRDYLALEKMRFEERLSIELDINEDTLQQPVPPMMLQTLVENAIKHGISKKVNGGTIRVISDFVNNQHELVVQNSGQLGEYSNGNGFGLRSTEDRLNLLYQGKASFAIKNMDNEMVESRITMPVAPLH